MRKFKVTKNDCYCSFESFYDNIAKKMGMDPTKITRYDPKRIKVSEDVMEELLMFMRDQGMEPEAAHMIFLNYGPGQTEGNLIVEVESGFATADRDLSSKSVKKRTGRGFVSFKDIKRAKTEKPQDITTVLGVFPMKGKVASKDVKSKKASGRPLVWSCPKCNNTLNDGNVDYIDDLGGQLWCPNCENEITLDKNLKITGVNPISWRHY